MKTNKQKVLALIPRDKTLSEGCEVIDPFCTEPVTLVSIKSEERLNTVYTMRRCADGNKYLHTASNLNNPEVEKYKIIGHPPTLNDLLRVLEDGRNEYDYCLALDGHLLEQSHLNEVGEMMFEGTGIYLPLNYRHLTDIPENHDCWKGLRGLLVKE